MDKEIQYEKLFDKNFQDLTVSEASNLYTRCRDAYKMLYLHNHKGWGNSEQVVERLERILADQWEF